MSIPKRSEIQKQYSGTKYLKTFTNKIDKMFNAHLSMLLNEHQLEIGQHTLSSWGLDVSQLNDISDYLRSFDYYVVSGYFEDASTKSTYSMSYKSWKLIISLNEITREFR